MVLEELTIPLIYLEKHIMMYYINILIKHHPPKCAIRRKAVSRREGGEVRLVHMHS